MENNKDYLKLATNEDIMKLISKGEKILFSVYARKFNTFGWKQKRTVVITEEGFYNFDSKKLKRRISITKIDAVIISSDPKSREFVLHSPTEYDYRYTSDKYFITKL